MPRNRSEEESRVAEIRDSLKRTMRVHTYTWQLAYMQPRIHVSRGMLNTRYRGSDLFDPEFIAPIFEPIILRGKYATELFIRSAN